jgi:hypothetical protein
VISHNNIYLNNSGKNEKLGSDLTGNKLSIIYVQLPTCLRDGHVTLKLLSCSQPPQAYTSPAGLYLKHRANGGSVHILQFLNLVDMVTPYRPRSIKTGYKIDLCGKNMGLEYCRVETSTFWVVLFKEHGVSACSSEMRRF